MLHPYQLSNLESKYNDNLRWYAVRVMARHEKSVSHILTGKGFPGLVPLYSSCQEWGRRHKTVQLPLFPGYVFCQFDPEHRVPILNTPGVIDIVRFGKVLAEIDPAEVSAVRRTVEACVACEPWPNLEVGARVTLERGPLAGVEGIVVEVRQQAKLVVSITLLHRALAIEIDRGWIRSTAAERLQAFAASAKGSHDSFRSDKLA